MFWPLPPWLQGHLLSPYPSHFVINFLKNNPARTIYPVFSCHIHKRPQRTTALLMVSALAEAGSGPGPVAGFKDQRTLSSVRPALCLSTQGFKQNLPSIGSAPPHVKCTTKCERWWTGPAVTWIGCRWLPKWFISIWKRRLLVLLVIYGHLNAARRCSNSKCWESYPTKFWKGSNWD